MKIILFSLIFFPYLCSLYAGGSESFTNQVLPILRQDKVFAENILDSFDFNDAVLAQTRLGSHTKFGGQRLGPYFVKAKPKNSTGPWIFDVKINTKWIVYDKEGKEIPLLDEKGKQTGIFDEKASCIYEKFINLEVTKTDNSIEKTTLTKQVDHTS